VTVDPIKTQPSATRAAFGYVQIEKIINHDQTSTTTRPHRCPTRSSRWNLSAGRLVHDAGRLRPRQRGRRPAGLVGSGVGLRNRSRHVAALTL
jgi:hypothetical protein